MHGYDIDQGRQGRQARSTFAFPATIEGVFEAELEGRKEQILELTVNPEPAARAAARARAGRAQRPADPGLALRLGGVDRPDRLLLRALGRLAKAALRGRTLAAARGAAVAASCSGVPTQVLCGAIGVFLLGVAVYTGLHGTEAPDRNFAITFLFVTAWLGFPLFSVSSATSSSRSTPGGRSAGRSAAASG